MATIQRPLKQYDTRKYVDEVAADPDHLVPVLAAEVDADFDVIFGAWNGGVDAVNVKPGAITTDKIADGSITDPKIVSLSWNKVTGAPTGASPGGAAGGDLSGTYPNPQIRDKSIWGDNKIQDYSIVGIRQLYPGTVDTPQLAIDAALQFGDISGPTVALPLNITDTAQHVLHWHSAGIASRGGLILMIGMFSGFFQSITGQQGIINRLYVGGSATGADGTLVGFSQALGYTAGSVSEVVPFQLVAMGLFRGTSGGTGPFKMAAQLTGLSGTMVMVRDVSCLAVELA